MPRIFALFMLLLAGGMLAPVRAADPPANPIPWNSDAQGAVLMSLCRDRQGHLWVGTEDRGVWRYSPDAAKDKAWTHFTTRDGLGDDNAYALACDQ